MSTQPPNISGAANKAGNAIKNVANELVEMKENTAITLMTFLTFLTIIMAFLYYFYFNGTGTVGGIFMILILTIMLSIVGQAVMGASGLAAGGILGVVIGILIFVKMINGKVTRDCNVMNTVYGEKNTAITSLSFFKDSSNSDNNAGERRLFSLYDYYIKTAYNCCSGGNYKNDYVSLCSLQDLLKQGVRGLDFEIYSINDEPVVATSTVDNYCVKETFNYVKFSDAINTVVNNAFTDNVPNPNDPIIFHLRIKSENKEMYKKLGQLFEDLNGKGLLMGPEYSNEYRDNRGNVRNFGAVNISEMMGKIIIVVDRSNTTCLCADCGDECGQFYEFVNMTSYSTFMQLLRYNDIEYTQTPDDLINQNRRAMTIGVPNKGSNPSNPSSAVMRSMGIQMLAMRYQMVDANVEENDLFFNEAGHAFALKPENLRAIVTVIEDPVKQDPAYSYETRTVKGDFYELDV
jgi:hypothetical protein